MVTLNKLKEPRYIGFYRNPHGKLTVLVPGVGESGKESPDSNSVEKMFESGYIEKLLSKMIDIIIEEKMNGMEFDDKVTVSLDDETVKKLANLLKEYKS